MNSIIKAVAKSLLLKPRDLKGKSTRSDIVLARYIAMYIILQRDSLSSTEVSRAFNRCPGIASRAYQRIARRLTTDHSLREYVLEIGKGGN